MASTATATTTFAAAPRLLLLLTVLCRILIYFLAAWASQLPLFDASPNLISTSPNWFKSGFRWDVFHFDHISHQGYVYEHEWAFFPGLPFILSVLKERQLILLVLMVTIDLDTTNVLYRLSLQHFSSPNFALLVSFLSLLPSSPASLRLAPYNEPFFTHLSYRGRHAVLLTNGFIVWGLLVQPFLNTARPPAGLSPYTKAIIYSTMILTPFVFHQATGYSAFCINSVNVDTWCSRSLPLIYSHVQSKYWNGGLFQYWTLAQLPNFIIAAPPLIIIIAYSTHIVRASTHSSMGLVPHAIHACVLGCTLFFASNVQIILRLAPSMPLVYWAAAWLVMDHPKVGRWWVGWSVTWGMVAILLWSVFLPPA
ncbi:hypothetical protein D9757_004293 [Collybiopsis confluens]|uniref:GPI mannosyltransferase 2 n=1 Tax=Collybiopsis confluens TaxID=2823264 RepID=A0A8H5MD97_9AGAR|nr:hypothetical protein D9757_004293 [Collybiopsis confluens]